MPGPLKASKKSTFWNCSCEILTSQTPFLTLNQECQSTEGGRHCTSQSYKKMMPTPINILTDTADGCSKRTRRSRSWPMMPHSQHAIKFFSSIHNIRAWNNESQPVSIGNGNYYCFYYYYFLYLFNSPIFFKYHFRLDCMTRRSLSLSLSLF